MRTSPLRGLMRKSSPATSNPSISDSVGRGSINTNIKLSSDKEVSEKNKQKQNTVRTDATTRYDPITLQVDSTPVGQRKVKQGGYGFSAAVSGGTENASMWKNKRDAIATDKVAQSNKEKSRNSKPGSGGVRPIMPGE